MAHGFLQSFDPNLYVCSAGTYPTGKVNEMAIKVMREAGVDISHHSSDSVEKYIHEEWDYVITVCDEANETCPVFTGKVKHRLHKGYPDPSETKGSEEYVLSEFRRIRDLIKRDFYQFYLDILKES